MQKNRRLRESGREEEKKRREEGKESGVYVFKQ